MPGERNDSRALWACQPSAGTGTHSSTSRSLSLSLSLPLSLSLSLSLSAALLQLTSSALYTCWTSPFHLSIMAPAPSLGVHAVHLLPREGQREKRRDGEKESNIRQYRADSVWHCDSRQRSNSAGTEPSNIISSGAVGLNLRVRLLYHCVQISKSVFVCAICSFDAVAVSIWFKAAARFWSVLNYFMVM